MIPNIEIIKEEIEGLELYWQEQRYHEEYLYKNKNKLLSYINK